MQVMSVGVGSGIDEVLDAFNESGIVFLLVVCHTLCSGLCISRLCMSICSKY